MKKSLFGLPPAIVASALSSDYLLNKDSVSDLKSQEDLIVRTEGVNTQIIDTNKEDLYWKFFWFLLIKTVTMDSVPSEVRSWTDLKDKCHDWQGVSENFFDTYTWKPELSGFNICSVVRGFSIDSVNTESNKSTIRENVKLFQWFENGGWADKDIDYYSDDAENSYSKIFERSREELKTIVLDESKFKPNNWVPSHETVQE